MKLEEIKPKRSSFKLNTSPKEYFIRAFTLEDQIWFKNNIGGEISDIFSGDDVNFDQFSRLIYRLLCDKSDFKKTTVVSFSEDGDEIEESIGGYKKFQRLIITAQDTNNILNAFNEAWRNSNVIPSEDDGANTDKKKV